MKRRDFVASSLLAGTFPLLLRSSIARPAEGAQPACRSFALSRIRLLPGPFREAMEVNRRFLMSQDADRLLHMFRVTAGLASTAEPLGGWEAPENELRGHYTGHYLSACALMWATEQDAALKARADAIVSGLAACQQSHGNGYLSAFPEELFDRLRAGQPVWAPFYTVHKIMAGLLDMHRLAGNAQALEVLTGMVRWTARWVQPLGDHQMARVLEREYGGMNELLYDVAELTRSDATMALAHRFDHERIFAPLANTRDDLKGLHVNTTIPKVIGAARRYELTEEGRSRRIADYFWRQVTTQRCYCTGGTSNDESWNTEPGILSTELSGYTQEDCVTHNLLKLTDHIFQWTGSAAAADYHERALINGILGSQDPVDGEKLYYVSLADGYWKLFGTPFHDYWCCTGTMSEAFAQFGKGVYYQDEDGLIVNQFIASELDWRERAVRLVQETRFPEQAGTRLTIRAAKPVAFALRIRIPWWSTNSNRARINGKAMAGMAGPGGYLVVERTWKDGDRLELDLPMSLHTAPMPDDAGLQAVMYGPMVLAGRLGTEGLTPETLRAKPTLPREVPLYPLDGLAAPGFRVSGPDPRSWISAGPNPLSFTTVGQARDIEFVPFHKLFGERYAIYWRIT
jgi:DUF1680 family protein